MSGPAHGATYWPRDAQWRRTREERAARENARLVREYERREAFVRAEVEKVEEAIRSIRATIDAERGKAGDDASERHDD